MANRGIIVIGASCGGVSALSAIVSHFPKDFRGRIYRPAYCKAAESVR
jgi:chemotaxis response regulator CheB